MHLRTSGYLKGRYPRRTLAVLKMHLCGPAQFKLRVQSCATQGASMLGMFCAGDAKLLCVIGACWGLEEFLSAFVFTLIIGGVFSLFYMMVKKELKLRLLNVLNYFKTMALTMQFRKYTPVEGLKNDMPFSVFILLGAVSSLIYKAIS